MLMLKLFDEIFNILAYIHLTMKTLLLLVAVIPLIFLCEINSEPSILQKFQFEAKRTFLHILDSCKIFLEKVKIFFVKPLSRLEKIRQRIKKAFYEFINQSFSSTRECNLVDRNLIDYVNNKVPEMPMFELIANHNFKTETHTVVTKDGYMLTLHRILKTTEDLPRIEKNIVLLHHGLWGSAMDWITLGPQKSLPYLLVDAGYDVWLANARGNKYSNGHVSKSSDSSEYWNFSWHEIGLFDISSVIEYLIETSEGKSEIIVIAYSMGATALLVLLSSSPQYNSVIKSAILIAPLVFMNHAKGPIRYLAEMYDEDDLSFLSRKSRNEIIPNGTFSDIVKDKYCRGDRVLCSNILFLFCNGGKDIANINVTTNILPHVPAGGSKKTLFHYLQLLRSGRFQMFDYGFANTVIYGSELPTAYPLNHISVPLAVISSLDDWLSNVKDIANLLPRLFVVNHTVIIRSDFSHLDFLWAQDAPHLIYFPILNYLREIFSNSNL